MASTEEQPPTELQNLNENESGAKVVIKARRTELLDAPDVRQLAQPWTDKLFGRVSIANVIEKAILAVTLFNEHEETMGHAAFYDYPNIPDVVPSQWETWMTNCYGSVLQHSSLNSLFVHYFVANQEYTHLCAREILNTAFNVVPDLQYIFLMVPEGQMPDASVATLFEPLPKPESNLLFRFSAFVCHRENHVPMLKVRIARVQDHDDLAKVFDSQTDKLKELYGEYFLAELIDAQDEHMHCLSAEVCPCQLAAMGTETNEILF
ncbi:hypothetical protein ACOMHN_040874 [Nucella lapillus]